PGALEVRMRRWGSLRVDRYRECEQDTTHGAGDGDSHRKVASGSITTKFRHANAPTQDVVLRVGKPYDEPRLQVAVEFKGRRSGESRPVTGGPLALIGFGIFTSAMSAAALRIDRDYVRRAR